MDEILSKNVLNLAYTPETVGRYGTQPSKRADESTYLNEHLGQYQLSLIEFRTGIVGKEGKNFGKSYVATKYEVLKAEEVTDQDGNTHTPGHKEGDIVTCIHILGGRVQIKKAAEMVGSLVGTPPALIIPDGMPHEGKVLPLVTNETFVRCSEDNGAPVEGREVQARVVPYTATKGPHAGKTYRNEYFKPADGFFPNWDELAERGVDMEALVEKEHGHV